MNDNNTIKDMKQMVTHFCQERDWNQFHTPKDLAIGISTEANELLDIFRFKSEEDMEQIMRNPAKREAIGEELADALYFILQFAKVYDFDLGEVLEDKLEKNSQKYPVKKVKGKNLKYNEI